jgi:hypothetical protein
MRKYVVLLLVFAAAIFGIAAAETMKDFRYTDVDFAPIDTMGTIDTADNVLLPAELGELLPDADADGLFDVSYVVKKKGTVSSTNPGQLYGVITVNNTTATNFTITDTYGSQFDINPAKIGGGVQVIRVDAGGIATVLTRTAQVVSGAVDNSANTADLEIMLDEPLAADEKLMIFMKFKNAMKKVVPDYTNFVNNVSVTSDGTVEATSATIEFV